jgi:hypothetical protein
VRSIFGNGLGLREKTDTEELNDEKETNGNGHTAGMRTSRFGTALGAGLGLLVLGCGVAWFCRLGVPGRDKAAVTGNSISQVTSLSALLALPVADLQPVDVARMNLLCAQGLPGSEDLDLNHSLAVLDEMAARVRSETERHFYRFQRSPAEFENSEGFFRMILLAVVLDEDFGVHYAPGKRGTAAEARIADGFFADAHDVFLHGLTGPRHSGTCSSLPVLQVAVGRRLGYPLKLVTTKGHLFVRWEDARERFNIEAAGEGVNRFSDDYYRHWPLEVTEEDIRAEGYEARSQGDRKEATTHDGRKRAGVSVICCRDSE